MATHRACTLTAAEDINDPELRAAYWDALALIDSGWQLRRLRYIPATNAGVIVAHTPTGRPVTIPPAPTLTTPTARSCQTST